MSFYDAINLFKASQTGQGNRGTPDQRRLARQVVVKMWQLFGEDELAFDELDLNVLGHAPNRCFVHDIEINQSLQNDLAGASVVLVHEVVHTLRDQDLIDEELIARELQDVYCEELLPPGVTYYNRRRQRRVGQLRVGSPVEVMFRAQRFWAAREELVDVVLAASRTYSNSLEADWVRRHFHRWGGLRNRWASTRGHFIRVLAEEGGDENCRRIIEILESIEQQSQWTEMMRTAGGEAVVREAIHRSNIIYGDAISDRVQALQARWHANLGMQNAR